MADERRAGESDTPPSNVTTEWTPRPHPATGGLPPAFGEYRVIRELREGGMGRLLEAEDPRLGRRVAIKLMRQHLAATPDARERFLREARAAAAVRHEHVAPIYHVGEQDGMPFLVMPLLDGESLAERLGKVGALPPAEVARIGREAALGLAAAHGHGLVHRDVKPGNLFLEAPAGRVVILDFGLAQPPDAVAAAPENGSGLGTPYYVAPEQARGEAVDARADLFGLGATLYHAATGTRPFPGDTLSGVLKAVAAHDPRPPHEVNPAVPLPLSRLIMRLLAKNPADRPASAAAVADELRPTEPKRFWVWLTAAAAIVAVVAIGWLFSRPDPVPPEDPPPAVLPPPATVSRYRGSVDVKVERGTHLVRLTEPGALPLARTDKFVIEGKVDPPAYVYVVWVDPGHDVTPVYPWDPEKGWGSRPAKEQPVAHLRLPPAAGDTYRAPQAKPGVATMVLFARPTPLDVPDEDVKKWFENLPELPLPAGGEGSAVWFDDYREVTDPGRLRTFERVARDDPFARWQGELQKVLGNQAAFQSAVSFARTGGK